MVKFFSFDNLSFTKNKCICLNGVLVTFSIVYFAVSVQIVGDVFAPALLCFVNLSFSNWSIGTFLCYSVSKGAGEGVERCDVYSVSSPFISSHRHVAFISQVTCHFIYVVGGKNNWTSAAVLWMWAVAVRKAVQTCSCRMLTMGYGSGSTSFLTMWGMLVLVLSSRWYSKSSLLLIVTALTLDASRVKEWNLETSGNAEMTALE